MTTTNNDASPLFEALDTDPGSLLVSYLSNLHPLLVLSAASSSLSSLCPSSDAFLSHVSRRPRLAHSPFFSYFEKGLDAIADHAGLIEPPSTLLRRSRPSTTPSGRVSSISLSRGARLVSSGVITVRRSPGLSARKC